MNLFDWLKEITYNKTPWTSFSEEDKKSFEPYMVNRFLSMNQSYVELVNYVQRIPYTEKEKYYTIYCGLIPKKQQYLKYIKSSTKVPNADLLKHIARYFECSTREAELYISLLKEDEVKKYLRGMGLEEKEIKKLLK